MGSLWGPAMVFQTCTWSLLVPRVPVCAMAMAKLAWCDRYKFCYNEWTIKGRGASNNKDRRARDTMLDYYDTRTLTITLQFSDLHTLIFECYFLVTFCKVSRRFKTVNSYTHCSQAASPVHRLITTLSLITALHVLHESTTLPCSFSTISSIHSVM